MLTLSGVRASYGRIEALHGIDIEVGAAEIVSLIGSNGAGKSTTLMTICGRPRATHGTINFGGANIASMPTYSIMRLGIAHAPEGRRIFPRMTVFENSRWGRSRPSAASSRKTFATFFLCFLFSAIGSINAAARSRAANSKCSRSAGP